MHFEIKFLPVVKVAQGIYSAHNTVQKFKYFHLTFYENISIFME